jgi:predicted transcriptional regulator
MPGRHQQSLSPAQLEIMEIVWSRGEAGVAEIWQELSSRRDVARNTVQTMVSRLAEKGWLTYRQEGNAFHYTAKQPRQTAVGSLVRKLVQSAFGGSASGLVLTLLKDESLTKAEADEIRAAIDAAEKKQSPKRGRGKR